MLHKMCNKRCMFLTSEVVLNWDSPVSCLWRVNIPSGKKVFVMRAGDLSFHQHDARLFKKQTLTFKMCWIVWVVVRLIFVAGVSSRGTSLEYGKLLLTKWGPKKKKASNHLFACERSVFAFKLWMLSLNKMNFCIWCVCMIWFNHLTDRWEVLFDIKELKLSHTLTS